MLQHDEQFLQLNGDLDDRGQDDEEGALLLAGRELSECRLHHFRVAQKPVEIV